MHVVIPDLGVLGWGARGLQVRKQRISGRAPQGSGASRFSCPCVVISCCFPFGIWQILSQETSGASSQATKTMLPSPSRPLSARPTMECLDLEQCSYLMAKQLWEDPLSREYLRRNLLGKSFTVVSFFAGGGTIRQGLTSFAAEYKLKANAPMGVNKSNESQTPPLRWQ